MKNKTNKTNKEYEEWGGWIVFPKNKLSSIMFNKKSLNEEPLLYFTETSNYLIFLRKNILIPDIPDDITMIAKRELSWELGRYDEYPFFYFTEEAGEAMKDLLIKPIQGRFYYIDKKKIYSEKIFVQMETSVRKTFSFESEKDSDVLDIEEERDNFNKRIIEIIKKHSKSLSKMKEI